MRELMVQAAGIIREAGEIARRHSTMPMEVLLKEQGDVVTSVDEAVDRFVVSRLNELTPDFDVVSEESRPCGDLSGNTWILDPIDGSKHYAQGIPIYGISLALYRGGEAALGVVYAPTGDDLFTGIPGVGAWRNGHAVNCTNSNDLLETIVCVEMPSRHQSERLDAALRRLRALILGCQRVRMIGVTSLGTCYCAVGGFGAYVNLGSAPNALWDRAGGETILLAAGCRFHRTADVTVAANPRLLAELVDILQI